MIIDGNYAANGLVESIPNFEKIVANIKNELTTSDLNRLKLQSLLFELVSISGSIIPYYNDLMESTKQVTGKSNLTDNKNNLAMKIFTDSNDLANCINVENMPVETLRTKIYHLITLINSFTLYLNRDIKPILSKKNKNITEHNLDKSDILLQQDLIESNDSQSTFQHKQNYLMMNVVELGPQYDGIFFKTINLDTNEKTNYHLKIEFWVSSRTDHNIKDGIKWYVLDNDQFLQWERDLLKNWQAEPTNAIHIGDITIQNEYFLNFKSNQEGHLYVILDNRMAIDYTQHVALTIVESWKESVPQTAIVTTFPTEDESLKLQIDRLIDNSKKSLKIISPYIDTTYLTKLVQKRRQNIDIKIIVREDKKLENYAKKELDLVRKEFPKNIVEHEKIHSRLIIRDDEEMLISSADLNKRSLHNQANLGIRINDPKLVKETVKFFKKIYDWKEMTFKKALFGDAANFYDDQNK